MRVRKNAKKTSTKHLSSQTKWDGKIDEEYTNIDQSKRAKKSNETGQLRRTGTILSHVFENTVGILGARIFVTSTDVCISIDANDDDEWAHVC